MCNQNTLQMQNIFFDDDAYGDGWFCDNNNEAKQMDHHCSHDMITIAHCDPDKNAAPLRHSLR